MCHKLTSCPLVEHHIPCTMMTIHHFSSDKFWAFEKTLLNCNYDHIHMK